MTLVLRDLLGENGTGETAGDLIERLNDEAGEDRYSAEYIENALIGAVPVSPQFFHHLGAALDLSTEELHELVATWSEPPRSSRRTNTSVSAVGKVYQKILIPGIIEVMVVCLVTGCLAQIPA